MIVPAYWAEGRLRERVRGRQVTIRRFGWSVETLAAAQAHADARTQEAMRRVLAGETLARREPKVSYNGAEGVPIREEIISRHGTTLVTRNIYGALCLNTPDVLFADVDFADEPGFRLRAIVVGATLASAVAVCLTFRDFSLCASVSCVGVPVVLAVTYAIWRFQRILRGGEERIAHRCIRRFSRRHPDWRLRVYRTPVGFRVLGLHRIFDTVAPEVAECFDALGTDPIYVKMCLRQRCFRARVSPKPWRVGIPRHIKPRPGVWPIHPKHFRRRAEWVESYEAAARNFAACRFIEDLGSPTIDPNALKVCEIHDELCGAHSHRPIA